MNDSLSLQTNTPAPPPARDAIEKPVDLQFDSPQKLAAEMRQAAIGSVFKSALDKASTLELTQQQIEALKAPFPVEAFQMGAGGNRDLAYIEHAYLRDRFDTVIGMGKWALIRTRPHWGEPFEYYSKTERRKMEGMRIYADCALLIHGCLVAEAIGSMDYYQNQQTNYGDAAEGAMTAAFRRCAKQFGVGLQAWKKSEAQAIAAHITNPEQYPNPVTPTAPIAPAPSRKATEKTRAFAVQMLCKSFTEAQLVEFLGCQLTEWPLEQVPTNKEGINELGLRIQKHFENKPAAPKSFWDTVIPVPNAGQKLEEYRKNPDTIKSLYDRMKSGDANARARFWGLAKEWKLDPARQTEADIECRAAFDLYLQTRESEGKA